MISLLVATTRRSSATLRCIRSSTSSALFSNNSSAANNNKATDDTIALEETAENKVSNLATKYVPRPIFPWVSSPEPLPRLIKPIKPSLNNDAEEDDEIELEKYYETDYFTKGGPLGQGWISPMEPWFRGALYINSLSLLGLSWPSIIIPWTRRDWEHDMENAFCSAFSNGVNGMIHDTYIAQQNDDDDNNEPDAKDNTKENEEYDINLDVTLDPIPFDEKNGGGEIGDSFNREEEECSMLQYKLRQLYQSAKKHSHPTKVNIVLRTVPYSAQIESMFPVFGLSRALVEDHPNLRHTYRNMMKSLEQKNKEAMLSGKKRLNPIEVGDFIMQGLQEVMERSAKLSDDNNASVTIVAQVTVNCKEVFCVQDVASGDIIQGYGDGQPRDVKHLVRFEMVVKEKHLDYTDDDPSWEMELGKWQITDWDDLLDGNVFFT